MKYLAIFSIILILTTNCKKENFGIPDTGRKIVINGLITTDDFLNVSLSRSAYINDISGTATTGLYDLENADVRFYQNGKYIDSLYYAKRDYYVYAVFFPGNYWSKSTVPLSGKKYEIIVKLPGLPDVTASTTIPNLVKIERVDTSQIILPTTYDQENNVGLKCKIEFTDPGNETNYYLFNIVKIPNFDNFSNNISFECQDPIIEDNLNTGIAIEGITFSDKTINGQKHSLEVIIRGDEIGYPFKNSVESYPSKNVETVYFKLYSITEEYFRYIQTLTLFDKNYSNPLAEPVIMYSNITGGYGIFSGAAVSSDSLVFQY